MEKISYILTLRRALKPENRNMPLFQNGSAVIIEEEEGKFLLMKKTDRDQWCLPGGLQELGETFEEVAIREVKEETGLEIKKEDLIFIAPVSGESRKNSYPNGDVVYNNTMLYKVKKYSGKLTSGHEEIIDTGKEFIIKKEVDGLKFFDIDNLPEKLMDKDSIQVYKDSIGR